MKIRFTYYQYKSKLATVVSILKSGIAGFSMWLFAFFIPAFIICMACGASGAVIGGVLGGAFGLALITYIVFCFIVDEEKINAKYLKKKGINKLSQNISLADAAKILQDIKADNVNQRDAFYQHLLLIVRDYAYENGLLEDYKEIEMKIGGDIRSHLRVYETMFGAFYVAGNEKNEDIIQTLEKFAFEIGIYYLWDLDLQFPNIRTGDILSIIGDYEPEQFNMQLSLLDDSPERISRNELIERIESEL